MKKIVICGGHLTPTLALIESLQRSATQIHFFGRKYATEGSKNLSAEYQIITKKKIKFYPITAGRLQRKLTRYTFPSLLKIPIGFLQSLFYLIKIRPDLIISFGGYLSLHVVFSGWLLGIDSITHEQAVVPGLATKINSLFVKKVFLSWPQTQRYFAKEKSQVIGNLVRPSIFNAQTKNQKINDFIKKTKNLIFVTGGNQGSHFLNNLIFNSQKTLSAFSVIHQMGATNYKNDHQKARKIKNPNYLAIDYIDPDDIGAVIRKASLVISRSGANTVWELALLAKPAILVPLPISGGNEQQENAKIMEKSGSAIVLTQDDLSPKILVKNIKKMIKNHSKYQLAATSLKKTIPVHSASKLASFVINSFKKN